jgi:hypothetical protein
MKRLAIVALVILSSTVIANAQEITKPIRYTWIATSCQTWNTAAAALIMANGSTDVLVMPTGRSDRPWVILKRVEEGSVFIPEDEPFQCEVFESVASASSTYAAMSTCLAPMILNVPDGRTVIASLAKCDGEEDSTKRRAAGH